MLRLCVDLAAEQRALDALVAPLSEQQWRRPVPYCAWNIYESIAHLWYFDRCALLVLTDPQVFAAEAEAILSILRQDASMPAHVDRVMGRLSGAQLLVAWRDMREALLTALRRQDPVRPQPWYGDSISLRMFIALRLMETWAHGQDIVDSLRLRRRNGERLRHIAWLGVSNFRASFERRGLRAPQTVPAVRLTAPSGELWNWGEPGAGASIEGGAEDFCLVVTQRRNIADTGMLVSGAAAHDWMSIAQCFAGPAADPPRPQVRTVEYA
jgi:uncharacterized protein (TIGR03084 family)